MHDSIYHQSGRNILGRQQGDMSLVNIKVSIFQAFKPLKNDKEKIET
jgi:hypothetical protein